MAGKCLAGLVCCGQCLKICACCCCMLSSVAREATFPAPDTPLEGYKSSLLNEKGLVWLRLRFFKSFGGESTSEITDPSPNNRIPAVYIKANDRYKTDYTIILSHGNAQDISDELPYARDLANRTNCDVLIYEYPGYSLTRFTSTKKNSTVKTIKEKQFSRIRSSQKLTNAAIESAWRFLVDDESVDPKKIIIFGTSIGSGPSVHLAAKRSLRGVINPEARNVQNAIAGVFLVSPILSTVRAILPQKSKLKSCGMVCCCGFFCFDRFANHKLVGEIKSNVAIMHARDDETVLWHNGEILHSKLKNTTFEPLWLDSGGHNSIPTDTILKYFLKFKGFLTDSQFNKYKDQKESIRAQRLEKLNAKANEATTDASPATVPAPKRNEALYEGFVPNKVSQPLLAEFSNGLCVTVVDGVKRIKEVDEEKTATQMSKEEIRKKRLEAMSKKK